jgi:hypothetical protein
MFIYNSMKSLALWHNISSVYELRIRPSKQLIISKLEFHMCAMLKPIREWICSWMGRNIYFRASASGCVCASAVWKFDQKSLI